MTDFVVVVFLFVCLCVFELGSCRLRWPHTLEIAEDNYEKLQVWATILRLMGADLRTVSVPGKHSMSTLLFPFFTTNSPILRLIVLSLKYMTFLYLPLIFPWLSDLLHYFLVYILSFVKSQQGSLY